MEINETSSSYAPWIKAESQSNSGTDGENKAADKSTLGKDDFLNLLITELKYQNPLEPMESREFISQMATFSSLEQMQNLNTSFDALASTVNDVLLPHLMLQQSGSMIGREISYLNPEAEEGQEILSGTVESAVIKKGALYYIVNNQEISASDIQQIGDLTDEQNAEVLVSILKQLEGMSQLLNPEEGEQV